MHFVDDLTQIIFIEDVPQKSDIIFIPGGACGQLAVTAAGLYHAGLAPYILPSGRYGKLAGAFGGSEDIPPLLPDRHFETEWAFLQAVLLSEGVPTGAILREERAAYTWENAIYSRQVTDAAGLTIHRAILCCQAYHARRARMYYEILYPDTVFYVCPTVTHGISARNWYLDPHKTDVVLDEIAKLGEQFHEIVREYGSVRSGKE